MKQGFLLLIVLVACLTGASHNVWAWEQAMTCDDVYVPCDSGKSPKPTAWKTPCVEIHLNEKGTKTLPFEDVEAVVKTSIEAWNVPDRSSVVMSYGGLTDETRIGYNPFIDENANIIVFRDEEWNESVMIMALTSVTNRSSTGQIYDADMEINTYQYRFGIVSDPTDEVVDLQNTLTHELGHVLGLDHSMVMNATMYPYAIGGETYMRDLFEDDIMAIETIYPLSKAQACDFSGEYFKAPPQGMTEGYLHTSDCSVSLYRPDKSIIWILLLSLWCLVCFIRSRVRKCRHEQET